ncbi:MAG: hypothetical protein ACJ757_09975 [Gaiellaceae bacterium]
MTSLRRPGLRFLVEAFVIVLTAVVTGLAHVGAWGIAGAVAVVWVLVAIIEYSLSHPRGRKEPSAPIETLPEPEPVAGEAVRVIPRGSAPQPAADERVAVASERAPEPEPQSEPEPVAVEPQATPEPTPEPEPVAAAPEPEPEPEVAEALQWNLWELDRALRGSGEVTEEQEFLLMYLRDYAGPDGSLPIDFDGLVRESFGDVLGAPAG